MTETDRSHWEARYFDGHAPVHTTANHWLVARAAVLGIVEATSGAPPQALDIACGAGGTLLWLARRGWQVTGVDISVTALAMAQTQLDAARLLDRATLIAADLDVWRPVAESYDLVASFFFLDRNLWPAFRTAVRPHGLICLSTYHTGRLTNRPDTNPAHLLAPGELAALMQNWGWRLLATHTEDRMESVLGQRLT